MTPSPDQELIERTAACKEASLAHDCTVSYSEVLGMFMAVRYAKDSRGSIGLGVSADAAAMALHPVGNFRKDPVGSLVAQLLYRDSRGGAVTDNHERIDELRSKISGWHFSREMLSMLEYDMSYTAEQLLHTLDEICGGYLR